MPRWLAPAYAQIGTVPESTLGPNPPNLWFVNHAVPPSVPTTLTTVREGIGQSQPHLKRPSCGDPGKARSLFCIFRHCVVELGEACERAVCNHALLEYTPQRACTHAWPHSEQIVCSFTRGLSLCMCNPQTCAQASGSEPKEATAKNPAATHCPYHAAVTRAREPSRSGLSIASKLRATELGGGGCATYNEVEGPADPDSPPYLAISSVAFCRIAVQVRSVKCCMNLKSY